jgi:hypothetical protein
MMKKCLLLRYSALGSTPATARLEILVAIGTYRSGVFNVPFGAVRNAPVAVHAGAITVKGGKAGVILPF